MDKKIIERLSSVVGELNSIIEDLQETKECHCQCGKNKHREDAKYCSNCGEKLKEASVKGSL